MSAKMARIEAVAESRTVEFDPLVDRAPSRYVVGIDLGTTNSAVMYVDTQESPWQVQRVVAAATGRRPDRSKRGTRCRRFIIRRPRRRNGRRRDAAAVAAGRTGRGPWA